MEASYRTIIWPWDDKEESIWGKEIVEKYGEITYLDRKLHCCLLGLIDQGEDHMLAMRRRLGVETSTSKRKQEDPPGESKSSEGNNSKLAKLREHRELYPSLTHRERLEALKQADKFLWGSVTFNQFKALVAKDNKKNPSMKTLQLGGPEKPPIVLGKTGYAKQTSIIGKTEYAKEMNIIGKTGYAKQTNVIGETGYAKSTSITGKNGYANALSPDVISSPGSSRDPRLTLPIKPYPGCPYPCQLCGASLNPSNPTRDNIRFC